MVTQELTKKNSFQKYEYGRSGNPTRDVLEKCLAALDGAKYGLCLSSGLGATTVVMGLLENGDEIICGDDVYGGTYRFLSKVASRFGIKAHFVEARDTKEIEKAITPKTKVKIISNINNKMGNVRSRCVIVDYQGYRRLTKIPVFTSC